MAQLEKLIITQLINYLNDNKDNVGLPCYVAFGAPDSMTGKALWFQALGGTRVTRQYIRGKFKGELSLALYYRLSAAEMDGIEANMLIPHETLAEWFEENTPIFEGCTLQKIEMTKNPTVFSKTDSGEITYQSIWIITYKN